MAEQMIEITETAVRELRLRYQAAHSAYQSCMRALLDPSMESAPLYAELAEYEAKAEQALSDARHNLLVALRAGPNGQTRLSSRAAC